jgi:hypothetical protein
MDRWMDRLFDKFGQKAILYTKSGYSNIRVIYQSVNSRFWQNMEHVYSPLGRIPRGQYLIMLPVDVKAHEGDFMSLEEKVFDIRKLETMYLGSKPIYQWSLCVEKGV